MLAAVLTVSDRSQHPTHDVVLTGADAKGRCAGGVFQLKCLQPARVCAESNPLLCRPACGTSNSLEARMAPVPVAFKLVKISRWLSESTSPRLHTK